MEFGQKIRRVNARKEPMKKVTIRFCIICVAVLGVAGITRGFPKDREDEFSQAKMKYSTYRKSLEDITIHQQMEMITLDGQITQEAKIMQKGRKYRIELKRDLSAMDTIPTTSAQKEGTIIFNGTKSWIISPASGKKEMPYAENKQYQRESVLWDFLLENGRIIREERVGDYDCFVVEVKDEKQVPYTLWIEKVTFNLIQAESRQNGAAKINYWNSDFRKVNGEWEIPYKMEIYVDSKLVSTNTVKSVQVNQSLEDELFDPDHEASVR